MKTLRPHESIEETKNEANKSGKEELSRYRVFGEIQHLCISVGPVGKNWIFAGELVESICHLPEVISIRKQATTKSKSRQKTHRKSCFTASYHSSDKKKTFL